LKAKESLPSPWDVMPWGQLLIPDQQNELSIGWMLTCYTAFYGL